MTSEAPTLDQIAEWLRTHAPHFKAWKTGALEDWLDWWARCKALGVVRNGEVILAVGIAYPCTRDQLDRDWNVPNRRGPYLYCECLVASPPRAALGLLLILHQLVPDWRRRILVGRRRNRVQTFGRGFLERWVRRLASPQSRMPNPTPDILTYES